MLFWRIALGLVLSLGAGMAAGHPICRNADWYRIGTTDGAKGAPASRIGWYRKNCGHLAVVPDAPVWEQGRKAGMKTYCRPENAYLVGRAGRQIGPVCGAVALKKMRAAFEHGRQYHEIGKEIRVLEWQLADARGEMNAAWLGSNRATMIDLMFLRPEVFRLENQLRDLRKKRRAFAHWQ